ncbi:glycosyltransferase [Pseudomonas gingeri]|uniref:glycosyltransferase n=1 Tax=Pseudomonas gingeri TaxID=117681 RepID=UPI0015A3EC29|nr:glycosyltransferase [Pseudomonas gingeri]NWA04468.1 glycosyltransferase [Pseudomonas gingeri]NWA15555.1 glycosyltransferase [Pseudomonas gingeri]NWA58273.1 glycosyltransferase [Pseudomonas gingeri]NWA96051.1 glycosyltransferase [Pseudomonas gingeri]NWB04585.1 glycosyltransferase [Pseudomonas gingeri]
MKRPLVLVVCNALDDKTRVERGIVSDSPAASRKVVMLCQALREAGARPCILSLGRGRANGSFTYFPRSVKRVAGVPVVYAPFSHVRFLSQFLSLFFLIGTLLRLSSSQRKAVIFYNRMSAYLPLLLAASVTGYRRFLDLEDGEVAGQGSGSLKALLGRSITWLYDRLCSDGALLACSALAQMTGIRPVHCYYGSTSTKKFEVKPGTNPRAVLMAGTLNTDTGADLLIETVRLLRQEKDEWARNLQFEVTGKGEALQALQGLANESGTPKVTLHGRTTDAQYAEVLERCSVGLALKPVGGPLADTTFPSKVIEFAEAGLLVLSTDISDVRAVLGSGAIYLTRNDSAELAALFRKIVEDPEESLTCARRGQQAAIARCAPQLAGRAVYDFMFGGRS